MLEAFINVKITEQQMKYVCDVCGWEYDSQKHKYIMEQLWGMG